MRRQLLFFFAFFFSAANIATACSCSFLSMCELAREAPVIFIGKVIEGGVQSLREDPWHSNSRHVRLEVIEILRGLPDSTKFVDVQTMPTMGMCSPNPYSSGRTYLVAPSGAAGSWSDGGCFSGRDIEHIGKDIELLRAQLKRRGPKRYSILGRVAAVERNDSGLVDYLLQSDSGKLLSGVGVWTRVEGNTYSGSTDAEGRYEIAVPKAGPYTIHASLAPYHPVEELVNLPGAGCTFQDLGLVSGSSISGKVWDRRGQPLKGASVGLIDIDHPVKEERMQPLRTAYTEGPDSSFQFQNVPLGRYLLVFNPNGPDATGSAPFPFESTYYPNGVQRAKAEAIEVNDASRNLSGKDIIIGTPVEFRTVIVTARFPDGIPMKTASIEITGDPVEPDGTTFFRRDLPSRDLEASFQVPVNRKFRIQVKDWHGRILSKTYESTHGPGSTTVTREFVITEDLPK